MAFAMTDIITDPDKDPLGRMLLDYLDGDSDAFLDVESPTMDMWKMEGRIMFRNYSAMDALERLALEMCYGRIVDVGAGSGCHSLWLREQGLEVYPIDISPGCVRTMLRQGIAQANQRSFFSLQGEEYDTVLMLMNGLGICGTIEGVNLFLQYIDTILARGGQVLVDSTGLDIEDDDNDIDIEEAGYVGETEFVMTYGPVRSDPFSWVYLDYDTLEMLAGYHSLRCESLFSGPDGRYLARISR